MEPAPGPWFWRPRPVARPRARLLCLPYAGANAMVYRPWAARLPPDVELVAVQLPGRGPRLREAPIARLEPLVEALGQELRPSPVPYVLFGHSMGGLLAFSLCRWLRARGLPLPAQLVISARRAPQIPDTFPPERELSDAYILDRLRRYGGTPEGVLAEPELLELLLPVFRADFALLGSYRHVHEEPLDLPLTALGGTADDVAQPPQIEAWREHTRGPFTARLIEGGHFFLHTAEPEVLGVLGGALAALPG